jgi:hypothetical protein
VTGPRSGLGLISGRGHGRAMALPALLPAPGVSPLHDGHEGGGLFDAYNLGVGAIVLVALALVGFGIYKLVQRRRGF